MNTQSSKKAVPTHYVNVALEGNRFKYGSPVYKNSALASIIEANALETYATRLRFIKSDAHAELGLPSSDSSTIGYLHIELEGNSRWVSVGSIRLDSSRPLDSRFINAENNLGISPEYFELEVRSSKATEPKSLTVPGLAGGEVTEELPEF